MKARSLIRFQLASGVLLAVLASSAFAQLPFFDGKSDGRPTLAPLLQKVTPAVVSIVVEGHVQVQTGAPFNDPFLQRFFGVPDQPQTVPQEGAGSGVIIDAENGYVLTNNHVIANADKVMVYLKDKREYDAKVIGSDEGTDIALLKIDADNLTELELGDSDMLQVGDFVLAIGNPFGLGQTVTSGIVSALGRSGINPEGYEDFIQTDASINPGNSGGALIDLDGELVGINSAIIAPAGGNVGIGFAVPSNMAASVVNQLLDYGKVRRGLLGVEIGDLEPDLAKSLNLDVQQGAVVHSVQPDSPAERADLQPGDVIVQYDGEDVRGASDLRNKVGLDTPGSTVALTYIRDGNRHTVNVTIGEANGATASALGGGGQTIDKLQGAEFRNLAPGDPQYRQVQGVLVASVAQGSPAERRGLMQGDVITAVNYRAVTSVDELTSAIANTSGAFGLGILRDGRPVFVVIR
jgi:serine protease DegQ